MESSDTLDLAGVVALSLVLPLYASAALGKRGRARKPSLAAIWAGQWCGGAAGLLSITGTAPPGAGSALAVLSCVVFGAAFRRQLAEMQTDAAERAA